MQFFTLLGLASLAAAIPFKISQLAPPLHVRLEDQGNSKVKAVVINRSGSNINVLKAGSLLDTTHTEKVRVYSGENRVKFHGIKLYIDHKNLPVSAFVRVPAGGSVENEFDVAEFHDLSDGGDFDIESKGLLHYALDGSTKLVGSVPFTSNTLTARIDGVQASNTFSSFNAMHAAKRALVSDSCSGTQLDMSLAALSHCAEMATKASQAALNGTSAKLTEYFKADSSTVRQTVSNVFKAIATECGSTDSGSINFECSDVENYCSDGIAAYANPSGTTVYCDGFWSVEANSHQCHAGDQGGIVIHEFTHISSIKGTDDYDGYGYDFVQSLSAEQNLNHADTYMLFANAIAVGC